MKVGEIDLFLDVWVLGIDHLHVSVTDLELASHRLETLKL